LTDHPVLIPTSEGAVGGIVTEPSGAARAALVLIQGIGRPARSGINSFWTRLARALGDRGVVTLRYDCSREGETLPIGEGVSGQLRKRDLDRRLLAEAAAWFRERVGAERLLLAGACSGSYLAIEMAGLRPNEVAATFLVVPYLRSPVDPGAGDSDRLGSGAEGDDEIDPGVLRGFQTMIAQGTVPPWIVIGENDYHMEQVTALWRLLGAHGSRVDLEVIPGMALHMLDQPDIQEQVRSRLAARVDAVLGLPAPEPARA